MSKFILLVKKLRPEAQLPTYGSKQAAGMDLYAAESYTIQPGQSVSVPTGIAIHLPKGYEAQIRGRSGLAFREYVFAFNGTIDADYRGEISVLLTNHGSIPYYVYTNARIAQMVLNKVEEAEVIETEVLETTERGSGGFGSTGTF